MTVSKLRISYTYDDYKSLPESMDRRYELLGGELYRVPAPTTTHQRMLMSLACVFFVHCKSHCLGAVLGAPVDVVFGEGEEREVVQPDIVFVRTERRHIIAVPEIRGPPDLVVEILSPGTEGRDRNIKQALYARYGVREYWIIDPSMSSVEVSLWEGGKYSKARVFGQNDVITTDLMPGLEVELREVFDLPA